MQTRCQTNCMGAFAIKVGQYSASPIPRLAIWKGICISTNNMPPTRIVSHSFFRAGNSRGWINPRKAISSHRPMIMKYWYTLYRISPAGSSFAPETIPGITVQAARNTSPIAAPMSRDGFRLRRVMPTWDRCFTHSSTGMRARIRLPASIR